MAEYQDLINGLALSPSIVTAFVRSIHEKRLDQRRGEGLWTIKEHLADAQVMLGERLARFAKEDRPVIVPYLTHR